MKHEALGTRPGGKRPSRGAGDGAGRTSVVSQNYTYICGPKWQRTAALQDAGAPTYAPENAKRLGVRLSSAAFESTRKVILIVRHHTSFRAGLGGLKAAARPAGRTAASRLKPPKGSPQAIY